MKKSNNKKTMIVTLIAVFTIIVVTFGATYAYWTWQSATNQQLPNQILI